MPVVVVMVTCLVPVSGVTFACQWSAVVSHLSNQVLEDSQTQVQGVIEALLALGMAISFSVSWILTQTFSAPWMFQICAVMAQVFLAMFVTSQLIPDKWLSAKSSC